MRITKERKYENAKEELKKVFFVISYFRSFVILYLLRLGHAGFTVVSFSCYTN